MEQFVNAKQLQRIINEANPDYKIGYNRARELLNQIRDKYPDVILPAFNVIPMCWVDEQMGTAYKRKRRPPKE